VFDAAAYTGEYFGKPRCLRRHGTRQSGDLLPIREALYQGASLKRIKDEIADKAGVAESDVPERLNKTYSAKETTLEFKLKVAHEDLTTQANKKGETYIPLSQAKTTRRAGGRQPPGVVVKKGQVYLSNDKAKPCKREKLSSWSS
jgi:hypothetical protein